MMINLKIFHMVMKSDIDLYTKFYVENVKNYLYR